jgi:hypothetical protein
MNPRYNSFGYGPGHLSRLAHLIPTNPCTDWINFSES